MQRSSENQSFIKVYKQENYSNYSQIKENRLVFSYTETIFQLLSPTSILLKHYFKLFSVTYITLLKLSEMFLIFLSISK